ncbi:hypothetical protein U14_01565 [Candidatus Moduliflexus flocculans]|uniref:DUF3096 domain-containing protein n=1 Tax=Candidatus Moduliflexus flocculans TaxID=1499966 RepID=A0A0S6VXW5_9BACT|nr:hypothetical protein U14_01565 [Candidatus Moduliflexus flocculans]
MIHPMLLPILALVAGILILIRPQLLNHIVAIYLIVVGVLGLLVSGGFRVNPTAMLAIVAGILILVQPKFLNYIVAVYLIVIGILGLRLF